MPHTDVLIIGAGPTGLALALWLHKQGIKVRIVDHAESPTTDSRALAVHARILELYRQLDLADEIEAAGYPLPATNIWVEGKHYAHIGLTEFGKKLSPYPYILILSQEIHEKILEARLKSYGIVVERRTTLQQFVNHESGITASLLQDDKEVICEANWIAGCDGAHSTVRHGINAKYEGATYAPLLYIADLESDDTNPMFNGEAHLRLIGGKFNLILPFSRGNRIRLIGTTTTETHEIDTPTPQIKFEDVLPDINKLTGISIKKVNWFSTYRSHHRIADKYRQSRAFIVGDAAHIHSPVGGQGMNTGIMDAINLAWKLATVIKNPSMSETSKNNLLDSYESERRSFALDVVGATDMGFTVLTDGGIMSHILRNWFIPYAVPVLTKFGFVQKEIFRRGSQLVCTYRGSSLSRPDGSKNIQAGDRLPWVKTERSENYSTMPIMWQIHVYGESRSDLEEWWCGKRNILVSVFEWEECFGEVGLRKDVVYLLRPDQYIAGIFEGDSVSALEEYFSSRGLVC